MTIPVCFRHKCTLLLRVVNEMTTEYFCPLCRDEAENWVKEGLDPEVATEVPPK
jgi:hypothetical protein